MLRAIAVSDRPAKRPRLISSRSASLQAPQTGPPEVWNSRDDGSAFEDRHHPRYRAPNLPGHLAQGQSPPSQRWIARFCSTVKCEVISTAPRFGRCSVIDSPSYFSDPLNPPSDPLDPPT